MLTIIVIIPVLTLNCSADEITDKHLSEFEEILPEEFSGLGSEPERIEALVGLDGVIGEILLAVEGSLPGCVELLFLLLGGVLLGALCERLEGGLGALSAFGIGAVVSVVLTRRLSDLFSALGEDITELSQFFSALIPILSGVTLSGGGVSTAAAHAAAMNTTVSLLVGILMPLMLFVSGFSLSVGALSAFGQSSVNAVSELIRGIFMWVLGIITALIMGTLALQTVISAAKDSAAIRAARYAASGMIPVVGGTVSASLATLASGLAYVKGVIGIGASAVILTGVISPLVLLLLSRGAISIAITVSELVGGGVISRVYSAARKSFDLFIAVYALSVLLFLFEIILFVMTEAPIG